jgi:hypothetical protein
MRAEASYNHRASDTGRLDLEGLVGSVAPGQSWKFIRGCRPMTLNNAGDEITLLDATGTARDRFANATSQEGKRILTTH